MLSEIVKSRHDAGMGVGLGVGTGVCTGVGASVGSGVGSGVDAAVVSATGASVQLQSDPVPVQHPAALASTELPAVQ